MSAVDLSKIKDLAQRKEVEALLLASLAADDAYDAAKEAAEFACPKVAAAKLAAKAAEEAYDAHPLIPLLDRYDYSKPRRCALSGVILHDEDQLLQDERTGEEILRCLVLPERAPLPEFTDGEEEVEGAEEEEPAF